MEECVVFKAVGGVAQLTEVQLSLMKSQGPSASSLDQKFTARIDSKGTCNASLFLSILCHHLHTSKWTTTLSKSPSASSNGSGGFPMPLSVTR